MHSDGQGYEGKYSIVADFVKHHQEQEIKKSTIRFETNPGLQSQVDWKEDMTLVSRNGEVFKINIFLMVLGYSRLKFIMLTSDRSQETLFNCMINAFKFFGGVPKEILFDNMKTVVDHSKSSISKTVFIQKFEYFAKDIGFLPIACRPYRPQTKGKVKALAKLMDRLKVYNEEFDYHFQPSVNKTEIRDLGTLRFLEHKENILFMEHPELGKHISQQQ